MKKMMIATAVICAVAMTYASQITWGTGAAVFCDPSTKNPSSTVPDGITLVLVNLGQTFDYSKATAKAIIPEKSSEGTTLTLSTRSSSFGKVSGVLKWTYGDGEKDLVNNGDYLVLMYQDAEGLHAMKYLDGSEFGSESALVVSGINKQTDSMSATQGAMNGIKGNFTTASVPEPTSSLLMLLGVAGLALRRRRA